MKNITLLARRELGAYIKSPMGYIIVAIVLFVDGLLFNVYALGGSPKLSAEVLQLFFAFATFMTMVSGVLLSMRLLAEERQLGTLTLLLTSPIRDYEIVLGKFSQRRDLLRRHDPADDLYAAADLRQRQGLHRAHPRRLPRPADARHGQHRRRPLRLAPSPAISWWPRSPGAR